MIFDSDILIWYLRGNKKAKEFISLNPGFTISSISYMELIQGIRNKNELILLKKQLQNWSCDILPITPEISHLAIFFLEKWALSHGLRLADALIAATAQRQNKALATSNIKHYRFIKEIQLIKFSH